MRSGCRIVSKDQYWCQHCRKGCKKKWNLLRHEEKCGLARSRLGNRVKKSQDFKKVDMNGKRRISKDEDSRVLGASSGMDIWEKEAQRTL
jgi:hypothetical protein